MNVDFAFLCDHAEAGNKLHAMGVGIDTLYIEDVPGVHAGFFAVLQLRFSSTEAGRKNLSVHVMEPDGASVARMDGAIEAHEPPDGFGNTVTRIVLGLKPIPVEKLGPYSVRWVLDGMDVCEVPFKVAKPRETT